MKRPSRYCVGTNHDFLQDQVGGSVEIIRRKKKETQGSKNNPHHADIFFLPSTKPAEVESIYQWCPKKLETKRPEDKAEEGLVFVADTLTL